METFSGRLAKSIEKSGLNRPEFAARAGCGTSALAKWLSGKLTPKSDQLLSIAQTAGVTMEWLLTGRGAPSIDATISAAEEFFGETMTGSQRDVAHKVLEKRELAFQPDKILRLLAETEDRLMSAEQKVAQLEEKLAAARKALE